MQVKLRLIFTILAALTVSPAQEKRITRREQKSHRDDLRASEITIATQVWVYPRIYPLMDGLLQDVAATQVSALTLSPNASNGVSLDALQQSVQLQLQYSQLAGIQNATSAEVASANAGFQTQLAQQGAGLLQQYGQASALATQAQIAYNTLSASPNASSADIATAQQVLTAANAVVTNLGTQLTNLKSPPAPTVPSAATPLTSVPSASTGIGSAMLTNGANAATTGTPSFPATKQMDNQMDMLWERLSRLVGVMARPDSMDPTDDIVLVKFDTSLTPLERKKQLLDVTYQLNCGTVVDLFPRTAALNITEDKYRDTSFGIGAVLNFFGLGGTVAYNREHLTATQLLGQSSYITGHGVGMHEFGWLFGISLGDDSISPGTRTTFALIKVPATCADISGAATNPIVAVRRAVWTQAPSFRISSPQAQWIADTPRLLRPAATPPSGAVSSIDFSRVEYDPTAGKPAPVMLTIGLNQDMDQQQTVSVNGQFIQRVRDNFGRAITATTNNSGGVLEAQGSVGINTWIPTSPRMMLLNLDASLFGGHFPRILLNFPKGPPILVSQGEPAVTVSGRKLDCSENVLLDATPGGNQAFAPPAGSCLPSLGYQKSATAALGVARWIEPLATPPIDFLSITVLNAVAPGTLNTAGGIPTVQVVSDLDTPTWGSDAEVDWISESGTVFPLSCIPAAGSRLLCRPPDAGTTSKRNKLTLQVIDQNHAGGPIKGFVSTEPCSQDKCSPPLVWKTNTPELAENNAAPAGHPMPDLTNSKWTLKLLLVNVHGGETAKLSSPSSSLVPSTTIVCNIVGSPCTATFTIARKDLGGVSDSMNLEVLDTTTQKSLLPRPASITNLLSNMKPLIGSISPDFKTWWGQNLVYNKIAVAGASYDVQCSSTGVSCTGSASYGPTAGLVYFLDQDAGLAFALMQVNTSGSNTPVTYTPPTPPKGTDNAAAQTANGGAAPKPGSGGTPPKPRSGGTPPPPAVTGSAPFGQIQLLMNQPFNSASAMVLGNLAPGVRANQ